MNIYEQRLRAYLQEQHIQAEHLSFDQPCHSVAEAARAVDASPEEMHQQHELLLQLSDKVDRMTDARPECAVPEDRRGVVVHRCSSDFLSR